MSLSITVILVIVVLVALIFALSNGLHDASSVVATFISCGAATPVQAVLLASVFGLLGSVLGGSAVADTITKIILIPTNSNILIILLAAIIGAVLWNIITWKLGLPSSSTHALIGGIIGAVFTAAGYEHVQWGWNELVGSGHHITGVVKVVAGLIISPFMGFIIAYIFQRISNILLRNAKFSVNKKLNIIQWGIAAALAFSHGANDTQKVFGLIALALAAAKGASMEVIPLWVKLAGGMVMFMGTMLGGWSIMKTIGRQIYDLRPINSTNSQLASGFSVFLATVTGAPVSTTHVVVGTVMGVGAGDEHKMVNWGIATEIITAWFITIPLSAAASAVVYLVIDFLI